MSTYLSDQLFHWRCEIAITGGYLQAFYRDMDRKQWDRAERISRSACEVLARTRTSATGTISQGITELQIKGEIDDCRAEQEAWLRAIQALMCLVCFFGMAGIDGRTVRGLLGRRTEAERSLGTALMAARTAFPKEELEKLIGESLVQALEATERALRMDLQESGVASELDPGVLAEAARQSCEEALRSVVREHLRN